MWKLKPFPRGTCIFFHSAYGRNHKELRIYSLIHKVNGRNHKELRIISHTSVCVCLEIRLRELKCKFESIHKERWIGSKSNEMWHWALSSGFPNTYVLTGVQKSLNFRCAGYVRGEIRSIYRISIGRQHSCHHAESVSPQFERCFQTKLSNERRIPTLAAILREGCTIRQYELDILVHLESWQYLPWFRPCFNDTMIYIVILDKRYFKDRCLR